MPTEVCTPIKPSFSEEQLALFERRFDNGYNLYMDSDYVTWLKIHHPESLPGDLHESIPIAEIPACINLVDEKTPGSDSFSDGEAESPGNYGTETPSNPMDDWNPALGSNDVTSPPNSSPVSGETPPPSSSPVSDVTPLPSSSPVSGVTPLPSSSPVSASTSLANTRQVFSAVTEFLTLPPAYTKKGKKPPGPARVLTSEGSLAMVLEKEKKKQKEEEAKVQRKLE